jgi:hypothetical protein
LLKNQYIVVGYIQSGSLYGVRTWLLSHLCQKIYVLSLLCQILNFAKSITIASACRYPFIPWPPKKKSTFLSKICKTKQNKLTTYKSRGQNLKSNNPLPFIIYGKKKSIIPTPPPLQIIPNNPPTNMNGLYIIYAKTIVIKCKGNEKNKFQMAYKMFQK